MLDYVKGQYAERVAFVYSNNNEQKLITYETFCNDVLKLSRKFTTKRTPIGLLGENSYKWIITYLAIEISDNIVIPLDHSANLETIVSEMETAECAKDLLKMYKIPKDKLHEVLIIWKTRARGTLLKLVH